MKKLVMAFFLFASITFAQPPAQVPPPQQAPEPIYLQSKVEGEIKPALDRKPIIETWTDPFSDANRRPVIKAWHESPPTHGFYDKPRMPTPQDDPDLNWVLDNIRKMTQRVTTIEAQAREIRKLVPKK